MRTSTHDINTVVFGAADHNLGFCELVEDSMVEDIMIEDIKILKQLLCGRSPVVMSSSRLWILEFYFG